MKAKKTYMHKKEDVERSWHLYDLKGKILGRAATEIATLLMGKHKPTYTPHVDGGDYVVAINAAKIQTTGKKEKKKKYYRHSMYPGGLKTETLEKKLAKNPAEVIELALKGMLPKNKLRSPRIQRLKVYSDSKHPHENHFKTKKDK